MVKACRKGRTCAAQLLAVVRHIRRVQRRGQRAANPALHGPWPVLVCTHIGDEGARELEKMLSSCPKLEKVWLKDNNFGEEAKDGMGAAFKAAHPDDPFCSLEL